MNKIVIFLYLIGGVALADGPSYQFTFSNSKDVSAAGLTSVTATTEQKMESKNPYSVRLWGIELIGSGTTGGARQAISFGHDEGVFDYGTGSTRSSLNLKVGISDRMLLVIGYSAFSSMGHNDNNNDTFEIDASGATFGIQYVQPISKIFRIAYGFDFSYVSDRDATYDIYEGDQKHSYKYERMEWRTSLGPQFHFGGFRLSIMAGTALVKNNILAKNGTSKEMSLSSDISIGLGYMI